MSNLRTDEDMGHFSASFWLVAFWEAGEILGLMAEKESKQECSQPAPRLEPC